MVQFVSVRVKLIPSFVIDIFEIVPSAPNVRSDSESTVKFPLDFPLEVFIVKVPSAEKTKLKTLQFKLDLLLFGAMELLISHFPTIEVDNV